MKTLAVLVAFLCLTGHAQASEGWVPRAQLVAEKVWGRPCERTGVHFNVNAPDSQPGLAWANAEACLIEFDGSASELIWAELCTAIIHEYGHLAGYRDPRNTEDPFHSLNPRSVMRPDLNIGYGQVLGRFHVEGADPRCYDRGRRYLRMRRTDQGWR